MSRQASLDESKQSLEANLEPVSIGHAVYGLKMDPGWRVSKAEKISETLAPGGHRQRTIQGAQRVFGDTRDHLLENGLGLTF